MPKFEGLTGLTASILAECDATRLFSDEEYPEGNVNWNFCVERANFQHKDPSACEFILHIGSGCSEGCAESSCYSDTIVREMTEYGCTREFIAAYLDAKALGATRILFHA